jgi:ATP-binding protein involved in chromosome partitioning
MAAAVREGGDYGRPIVISDPDSEAGKALTQLAQTVAARASVLMLQSADVIPLNVIG